MVLKSQSPDQVQTNRATHLPRQLVKICRVNTTPFNELNTILRDMSSSFELVVEAGCILQ